jgi:hypothetical protein
MTRGFVFVELGAVDHLTRPAVSPINGLKSMFCFFGKTKMQGELCASERSCYECASCFSFNTKASCKNTKYTGPLHGDIDVMLDVALTRDPSLTERHSQLQNNLKDKIQSNKNIVVRLKSGEFAIGRAAGKPFILKESTGKSGDWIQKGTARHPVYVVEMCQYEVEGTSKKGQFDCTYLLGTSDCKKHRHLCDCGTTPPNPRPPGWRPCYKRHVTQYRLRDVREPVGFTLQPTRHSHRNNQTKAATKPEDDRLRYSVPPLVKQQIQQNLNIVLAAGTPSEEGGNSTRM